MIRTTNNERYCQKVSALIFVFEVMTAVTSWSSEDASHINVRNSNIEFTKFVQRL